MARKKKRISKANRRRALEPMFGGMGLWTCIGLLVVLAYILGRVQINFAIHENDRLEKKISRLQTEVDVLFVQVSAKKSYERVVKLAQKQGLVFLNSSQIAEVPVDLEGLSPYSVMDASLRYAGISLWQTRKPE